MDSVRRQVAQIHEMEDYIDAQWGGPGKGWYRIVESPGRRAQVINDGKLAVVKGMEVSEPFNCRLMQPGDIPLCSEAELDDGIDEIYDDLGIRQLEIVNKFDNALTGVAGDGGNTGTITNGGNFLSAGTFWDYENCPRARRPALNHDHSPTAPLAQRRRPDLGRPRPVRTRPASRFPLYGPGAPLQPARPLSARGAGDRRVDRRGMLFDPDHMSVLARNQALDLVEHESYPGVMTSHSWSTDNALPRISAQGGLIGPAAKSPEGFVEDWQHIRRHGYDAAQPLPFGIGYGADMNGFASQGGPPSAPRVRSATRSSPRSTRPQTVDQQESGSLHLRLQHPRDCPLRALRGLGRGSRSQAADGPARSSTTWATPPRPTCRCGSAPTGVSPSGGPARPCPGRKPGATAGKGSKCVKLRAKLKRAKTKKTKRKLREEAAQEGAAQEEGSAAARCAKPRS